MREAVTKLWPEIEWIEDGKLREQVRSFYHLFYQVDLTEPDLDTLLGNSGG